jgi:hypothetical protein
MLNRWQFWLLTGLAVLSLVLGAFNASLFVGNRGIQVDVAGRQQYIAQSVQLQGLYNEIVRALADLSARNNDDDLRRVLAARGITVTVAPPAQAPAVARGTEGR